MVISATDRRSVGQGVKTPPFHGGNTGSNPVRTINKLSPSGSFFVYLEKIVKNNNQIVKKTSRIEKKSNELLYFYKIQIKVKESLWNLIKCIKK